MDSFNMSTIPYTSGDFKLEPCAQCYRAKLHAVTVTWAYTCLSFGTKLKSLFFFLKAMNLPKSEGQKDYFCKACCSCNNNYSSEIINITLLSCMHRPIQPKSLCWWRKIGNSLIFQHSPSRGGSLRPQTWNKSEQQLFYSISWWGKIGNSLIFQHSPSRGGSLWPQTWNWSEQQLFYSIVLTGIRTRDFWLWYHIKLHAPTNSTQKLKRMWKDWQFTYIPTYLITSAMCGARPTTWGNGSFFFDGRMDHFHVS